MVIFQIILFVLFAAAGAITYRWRGMSKDTVPQIFRNRTVRRILVAVLMTIGVGIATGSIWALLVGPLAFFGIIVGHGSYFSGLLHCEKANDWKNIDNEPFAPITRLISDPLNEKARFVGMALTGLSSTIPVALIPVIAFYSTGDLVTIAPWFALVGILKAVTYIFITPRSTEIAEYVWGAFLVGPTVLVNFDFGFWSWIF